MASQMVGCVCSAIILLYMQRNNTCPTVERSDPLCFLSVQENAIATTISQDCHLQLAPGTHMCML